MLLASALPPFHPAVAATGSTLSVSPLNSAAETGETFRVGILMTNVTDLYSYDVTLLYDTAILDAFNLTLSGTWFNTTGTPYDVIREEVDDVAGSVRVEVRIQGSRPGLNGTGTLVFIDFLVSTTGTSVLNIDETSLLLLDSAFVQIIPQINDGRFTTLEFSNIIKNSGFEQGFDSLGETIVYDSNDDGIVDTGDMIVNVSPPRAPNSSELGKALLQDQHIRSIDSDSGGGFDVGETVVFDFNNDGIVNQGDWVVSVSPPRAPTVLEDGTPLIVDQRLKFIDSQTSFVPGSFNRVYDPGNPLFWRLETFEGAENSTVRLDNTRKVAGDFSGRVYAGPIVCQPVACPNRPIGFAQFYQSLPVGTTFANVSDSLSSFSFWFYLEPFGSALGDFRVRVFGAEGIAEMDYVFDPDPSVSYSNQTGSRYLILQGYPAGQWHYFQRNLRADWVSSGFSLDFTLARIQFEGMIFQPPTRSESFWLDEVQLYAGPVPLGNQPPKVSFTFQPLSPYAGETVTFNASASFDPDPGGFIASYRWDFGDGTPIVVENNPITTHTYNLAGTFRIILTAVDDQGIVNAASRAIVVKTPLPCPSCPVAVIQFSPEHPLTGLPVRFNGTQSSDPEGQPLEYAWVLGDGASGIGQVFDHVYPSPGTYYVRLTVKDPQNLTATELATVTVSLIDVRIMKTTLIPYLKGESVQSVSLTIVNIGNVVVNASILISVESDRLGNIAQVYLGPRQELDVRDTYQWSTTFTTSTRARYIITFTLEIELPGGSITTWSSVRMTYRVIL